MLRWFGSTKVRLAESKTVLPRKLILPPLRPLETGHAAQRRSFAATRRAEKSKKLALLDGKIDLVDGFNRLAAPRTLKSLIRF